WSSTLRNEAVAQSSPGSKLSSAASSSSPSASAGNSALSVTASQSGVSPTPGSRIARSLPPAASASSRVTASAPTSSSARSQRGCSWARQRTDSSRKGIAARSRSGDRERLVLLLGEALLQVVDVAPAFLEAAVGHDPLLQRDVGLDPVHDHLAERHAHARDRGGAVGPVHDQLADHRVVVRRHAVALVDVRVHAHAGAAGAVEVLDQAGRGQEGLRVLGIDAALDRMPLEHDVLLLQGQPVAGGDAELLADQADAGDHLGDRVFDLDAGVQHDEVEAAVLVKELEGAGAAVPDDDAGLGADLADLRALLGGDAGGGSLLDVLLVAALHRAVALAQVDGVAPAVGEHLDLHVARVLQELLHVDHVVAERGL